MEIPRSSEISLLGTPRSTAESTLSLRSFEYAFMPQSVARLQLLCKPL